MESDFALAPGECAEEPRDRASIISFQLDTKREELSTAKTNSLRQRGATFRSGSCDLAQRRLDIIVFYGRLTRRETAIRAGIMLCERDILHGALTHEVVVEEDSLESEEFVSIDPLDPLLDHLERLVATAGEETADWRVAA